MVEGGFSMYTQLIKTPIGKLRIIAEEDSIIGIDLVREQQDEKCMAHGRAQQMPNDMTDKAAKELEEYFRGKRTEFSVCCIPRGTPFQEKVWQELCKVPYGETTTYGKLAVRIGNPKGARAVGMALNKNPILIMVPCHRIIGFNGSLTGFGAGMDAKRYLLDLEKDKNIQSSGY